MPDFTSVRILSLDEEFAILDKILKLKSYQYTVEVRKSTKIFMLAIYTKNRTPTTYLSDEQIKRLNEFNDYLNTPEAIECLKRIDRFMRYIILPIIFSLVVLFIFLLSSNKYFS